MAEPSDPQMPSRFRDTTIDYARGIAIVAIVLGHVDRGLATSGILDANSPTYLTCDRLLYLCHLTIFAFLTGLFVSSSVDKQGARRYLRSRDATFIYLYVLWSIIQGLVKVAAARVVNSPMSILDIFDFIHPNGQLWYLPRMIVVTTLAVVLRPWRTRGRAWATLVVSLAISLLAWGSEPDFALFRGVGLYVFFFAGVLLSARRFTAASARVSRIAAIWILVASAGLYLVIGIGTTATPPTSTDGIAVNAGTVALGFLASVLGLAAVLAACRLLPAARLFEWLSFVGQRTLEIFLASITFASGTRIALTHLGVTNPAIHVVLGLTAGVVGPLVIWSLLSRVSLPWLFVAPPVLTGSHPIKRKSVPAH